MNREYLNDVASKGAILGGLMLVSHIFEQYMLLNGNMARMGVVGIEMIAIFGVFVYLLYRFTKNYSTNFSAEEGFAYSKALGYIVTLSLFASIIVGLGSYLYTHFVIGYEEYVNGVVGMYTNILSSTPVPAQMMGTYEQMLEQISSQPEPSILKTITSALWNYLVLGGIVGLIIAGIVKREPKIFDNELQ
jgi:hypothetical protein